MPARLLREGILDSEAVNRLSPAEEVFYRRLMSVVDDYGRFDGRLSVLRSRLYSLRIDATKESSISAWLDACEQAGLVARYTVAGKPYLLLGKLGSPRNKGSKFPEPPANVEERMQLNAIENKCFQTPENAPGSGTSTGTSSGTGEDSSEPPKAADSEPTSVVPTEPILIIFPTVGNGIREWNLYPSQVESWRPAFPGVDVLAQCRLAAQWCDANPTKRKTARGMKAFLVRWLTKAQNDSGGSLNGHAGKKTHGQRREDEYARDIQNVMGAPYIPEDSA